MEDILSCRSLFHYIGSDGYVYVPQGTVVSNLTLVLYTIEKYSTGEAFLSKDANKTLALFPLKSLLGNETLIAPVNYVTSTLVGLLLYADFYPCSRFDFIPYIDQVSVNVPTLEIGFTQTYQLPRR